MSSSNKLKLIDIAVNLTDEMFHGIYRGVQAHADDFHLMMQRAKDVGIYKMMITGTTFEESKKAIELCKTFKDKDLSLYCTVGCHPTHCSEFNSFFGENSENTYFDSLLKLIQPNQRTNDNPDGAVVAIGECGLDYDRLHFCDKETQSRYFEKQLQLANLTGLPLFIHNRSSSEDLIRLLRKNKGCLREKNPGVVHSFDGKLEDALILIKEFDLCIGINGCSLRTEENLNVVKELPLDHLMVETDAPWCDIRPTHPSYSLIKNSSCITRWNSKKKEKFEMGKMVKGRNEPCSVEQVIHTIAALKSKAVEEIATIILRTSTRVFFPQLSRN